MGIRLRQTHPGANLKLVGSGVRCPPPTTFYWKTLRLVGRPRRLTLPRRSSSSKPPTSNAFLSTSKRALLKRLRSLRFAITCTICWSAAGCCMCLKRPPTAALNFEGSHCIRSLFKLRAIYFEYIIVGYKRRNSFDLLKSQNLYISLSLCLYISLSLCLSVSLSLYLAVSLSLYIYISLSLYLAVSLSTCLSFSLSLYLAVSQSLYISISLSL